MYSGDKRTRWFSEAHGKLTEWLEEVSLRTSTDELPQSFGFDDYEGFERA
jgi:hypothetical protein